MVVFPSITTLLMSLQFFPILTFSPITQLGPIILDGSIFAFIETIEVGWKFFFHYLPASTIIAEKIHSETTLPFTLAVPENFHNVPLPLIFSM